MSQFTQAEALELAIVVKEMYLPKLDEDTKNANDKSIKVLLEQRYKELKVITDKIERVGDSLL